VGSIPTFGILWGEAVLQETAFFIISYNSKTSQL